MTTAQSAVSTTRVMEDTRRSVRFWTLASLVVFLLSLAFWVGFLTVGGIFFTLSDGVALFQAAALIPVIVGYDLLFRPSAGRISRTGKWIGLTAMSLIGSGSIVLLTGEVAHEFIPAGGGLGLQFVGFGLEGVWFMLVAMAAAKSRVFSHRVSRVCFMAGVGFLLGAAGSPLGPEHPLVAAGGVLSLIGFVLWAVWSRRELR